MTETIENARLIKKDMLGNIALKFAPTSFKSNIELSYDLLTSYIDIIFYVQRNLDLEP